MEDLPPSAERHRKLPAELNCQIFYCLNLATRRKFIWGLGWNFYAMFRQILLTKTKRVCIPVQNCLNRTTEAIISTDGLHVSSIFSRTNIYAEKGFAITGKHARADSFPGTIIYYYEVKLLSKTYTYCRIGLSNGNPTAELIGDYPNSYAISTGFNLCYLAGVTSFELTHGVNGRDVYGCGILMDPNDKLAIFFTLNGILMGRISISPSVDFLFPAVTLLFSCTCIQANFGNDKDKPFEYDVKKCGWVLQSQLSPRWKPYIQLSPEANFYYLVFLYIDTIIFASATNAIILYIFSSQYRKIYQKVFPWLKSVSVGPSQSQITVVHVRQQRNAGGCINLLTVGASGAAAPVH